MTLNEQRYRARNEAQRRLNAVERALSLNPDDVTLKEAVWAEKRVMELYFTEEGTKA